MESNASGINRNNDGPAYIGSTQFSLPDLEPEYQVPDNITYQIGPFQGMDRLSSSVRPDKSDLSNGTFSSVVAGVQQRREYRSGQWGNQPTANNRMSTASYLRQATSEAISMW